MTARPPGLFADERAIIAGGAGRIGRAIATQLAAEGAAVHIFDSDQPAAESLVAGIAAKGGRAMAVAVDLADRAALDRACRNFLDRQGPPDMVVHAACPPLPTSEPDHAVDDTAWDTMTEVGLGASRRMVRHFLPAQRDRRLRARYLLVTSLHAQTPRSHALYSTTKAAMTMLVAELARELGPLGIRVNALAPGYVAGDTARPIARVPLGRSGTGDDVARMALVLLSDRFSSYVTGTTLVVDGGLSLVNWIPSRP